MNCYLELSTDGARFNVSRDLSHWLGPVATTRASLGRMLQDTSLVHDNGGQERTWLPG